MLCFGFSADKGLSVPLCEEVIKYSPYREAGVPIAGNVILKSDDDSEKYLGIWHRADIASISISKTEDWLDETDYYSNLFNNIHGGRGETLDNRNIRAKLFSNPIGQPGPHLTSDPLIDRAYTEPIYVPRTNVDDAEVRITDRMAELLGDEIPAADLIPFTYTRVGPFVGRGKHYAIRVSAHIADTTFNRLIAENPALGTRYYEVYGVDEILNKIRYVDLPQLRHYASNDIYRAYENMFTSELRDRCIFPDFYSIVAIDSLQSSGYAPSSMHTIEIKRDLKSLTDIINPAIFTGEDWKGLEGGMFWFVNRQKSQKFLLMLEGPMAETQIQVA